MSKIIWLYAISIVVATLIGTSLSMANEPDPQPPILVQGAINSGYHDQLFTQSITHQYNFETVALDGTLALQRDLRLSTNSVIKSIGDLNITPMNGDDNINLEVENGDIVAKGNFIVDLS